MTGAMEKEPLYHQTARGRFGIPAWWFGAPLVAFVYVFITPRWLPDLVTPPPALPANLAAPLRWFVGLLIGVAIMTIVQLLHWLRRREAQAVPSRTSRAGRAATPIVSGKRKLPNRRDR